MRLDSAPGSADPDRQRLVVRAIKEERGIPLLAGTLACSLRS